MLNSGMPTKTRQSASAIILVLMAPLIAEIREPSSMQQQVTLFKTSRIRNLMICFFLAILQHYQISVINLLSLMLLFLEQERSRL